jgi:microcompartment protein CcmK/EutM
MLCRNNFHCCIRAGIGDSVLVNQEGRGAHPVLNNPDVCFISVIVGIVDSIYLI